MSAGDAVGEVAEDAATEEAEGDAGSGPEVVKWWRAATRRMRAPMARRVSQ
jgi:hypothetical protein